MTNPAALAGVVARVETRIAAMGIGEMHLGRDIRTLLAALAEARKDSERLDWLQQHAKQVEFGTSDRGWFVSLDDGESLTPLAAGHATLREALDASRRTPQPETPE